MKLRTFFNGLWLTLFWASGLLILLLLVAIFSYLLLKGGKVLSLEFVTQAPKGLFLGMEGGILPAIKGTLALVAISTTLATIPALLTAIYLAEYSVPGKITTCITVFIQCMVGLPSILTGLFGYALFVVYMDFGISLLSGSLTLTIMIFPTLVVLMKDVLVAVNPDYRLLTTSLGLSRWYVLRRVILPTALPGLSSAILLGMGYATGATAPIMVTAAVISAKGSLHLLNPVMALPYHLYILFSQHISLEKAYGTALFFVLLLLSFNLLAALLRYFFQKEDHSL